MATVTGVRLALLARGYEPIPLVGKRPVLRGWSRIEVDDAVVRGYATAAPHALGTGLRTGNRIKGAAGRLIGVDIDVDDPTAVARIERALAEHSVRGLRRKSPSGRPFVAIRCVGAVRALAPVRLGDIGQIEVLGVGRQFAAYGMHPAGAPYDWPDGGPLDVSAADLPKVAAADLRAALRDIAAAFPQAAMSDVDGPHTPTLYTLRGDETFVTHRHGIIDWATATRLAYEADEARRNGEPGATLRASDTCIGGDGRNRTKCALHYDAGGGGGVMVYNFETGCLHRRRDLDPEQRMESIRRLAGRLAPRKEETPGEETAGGPRRDSGGRA